MVSITIESIDSLKEISPKEYNVAEINSIDELYTEFRKRSKAPTFLLTYQGTWIGLMKNCGFSEEEAKQIEQKYHEMYVESDAWVQEKLQQATKDGYVTLAFGLRLRTPLLAQSILNTTSTMNEASQEARTAGNALSGQSYGLLNNRAIIAFMKKVWASKWRTDIKPVALIHDAIYLLIKDDIECVKWVNDNLIEEMSWQELPEIQHPDVHLGAELDIYYPTWNNAITLPNNISEEEILAICSNNSL